MIGESPNKDDLRKIGNGMRVARHARYREMYVDDSVGLFALSSEDNKCRAVRNEKGTIASVISGEISNASELKQELESQGHVFSSNIDHEVLVHLFENLEGNPHAFQSIRGAFSFAIWDSVSRKLMLGLDKLGMRALYFSLVDENLLFASEIKGLVNHPMVPKKINPSALDFFFSYFYVPTEDTLIDGVEKVLPANYKLFGFGKKPILLSSTKYWQLDLNTNANIDASILCEEIYSAMFNSVKERVKDKPSVGVSLSGGLDSGVISTLLRRLDKEVTAFVIAIEGGEQKEAHLTAEFNGSKVEEIFVTSEDYVKNVSEIARILDEPIFEWALLPIHLIGQRAKKGVDMLFTGDGGDETFWGYPLAPRRWFDPFFSHAPAITKRFVNLALNGRGISDIKEKPLLRGLSLDDMCERISLPSSNMLFLDVLKKCDPADLRDNCQFNTIRGLASPIDACFKEVSVDDDLLRRYYALLTINLVHGGAGIRSREVLYNYHGVECAMPFMDERVVGLSYSIPSYVKQPSRFDTKYIMKKTIIRYSLLPEKMIKLRKRALGDPLNNWRRSKVMKEFIFDELDDGFKLGILKKKFVDKARSGTVSPGKCFGISMYTLWYKDFFMKDHAD